MPTALMFPLQIAPYIGLVYFLYAFIVGCGASLGWHLTKWAVDGIRSRA